MEKARFRSLHSRRGETSSVNSLLEGIIESEASNATCEEADKNEIKLVPQE
jgi:hypothetical protein